VVNKIKYNYKIIDRNSSGALSSQRQRIGSLGQNKNFEKEYYLYVHKSIYEEASYLITSKDI